ARHRGGGAFEYLFSETSPPRGAGIQEQGAATPSRTGVQDELHLARPGWITLDRTNERPPLAREAGGAVVPEGNSVVLPIAPRGATASPASRGSRLPGLR